MINNRQGGRRRGRGGQRPQNLGGRPDGNRQDNRQRGNAAQLLEKYKSMARDAQLGGDRVQTEYYLQYADHYYRILGESRARFEEQRQQRGDLDEDDGDDEQMEADDQRSQDDGGDRGGNERPDRNDRYERPQPRESHERFERPERNERPERAERPERNERPNRGERRPRYSRDEGNGDDVGNRAISGDGDGGDSASTNLESIAFDALPPAIGRVEAIEPAGSDDEAARPKRRPRKPRTPDGDGEVAPAA